MVSQKPKYCKNFERNSHWRKLSMIMVWECYCNASPKPELFLFSLFIFSFISQLIWVRLGWNFEMILHTKASKVIVQWSFLFVVLHKPTLLPSSFNITSLERDLLKSTSSKLIIFGLVARILLIKHILCQKGEKNTWWNLRKCFIKNHKKQLIVHQNIHQNIQ